MVYIGIDLGGTGIKIGVVDESGATVLEARYEEMSAARDGRLIVREGDVQGLIDVQGNWVYQIDQAREKPPGVGRSIRGRARPPLGRPRKMTGIGALSRKNNFTNPRAPCIIH